MSSLPKNPKRRAFIGDALKLSAGSLLAGSALASAVQGEPINPITGGTAGSAMPTRLPDMPTRVLIDHDGSGRLIPMQQNGGRFTSADGAIETRGTADGLTVMAACPSGLLARVVLRWEMNFPASALFLGDHWERGYGDLQWRFLQPERVMPWYCAAHEEKSGATFMAGVMTQPSTLCFWTVDSAGVSLWLDFRNGGSPCRPGDRAIAAATVVSGAGKAEETPFAALSRFCRALCPAPRRASAPICGNNNWYYAYGHNFDANAMRRDASFLASLAGIHPNRPYCVIDAGWTPGSSCPGGPWLAGRPEAFPDMPGLAADMKKLGVRPGIWMRPTALMKVDDPRRLRAGPCTSEEKPLDLSLRENLSLIHDDVARIRSWGYELIKHDFSSYDIFGRWGFEMGAELTDAGWHFADQSLTNAEIIFRLYRTLRDAAGDAVLLGCNTIGHIGAGIFEIQRTGDDTSGRVWERTRRMGVNTLAYRLPQHGAFFASDPDCAAHTANTPWELDRQFLDLVARSGTALFVSVDPETITPDQKKAFRDAMQIALSGGTPGGCEPLDWLHATTPREWRIGTEKVSYHWEEAAGANPLRV
jgi:alpha-galactosidase